MKNAFLTDLPEFNDPNDFVTIERVRETIEPDPSYPCSRSKYE